MSSFNADTSPAAEQVQLELMRRAPAWRKLHAVGQLWATLRTLALSGLRERYPHASEAELRRRLADLTLGSELAMRVYGPLPEENPDAG